MHAAPASRTIGGTHENLRRRRRRAEASSERSNLREPLPDDAGADVRQVQEQVRGDWQ